MRALLVIAGLVVFAASPAFAQDWRAVEVNGSVRFQAPGEPPRAVRERDVLPVGGIITTGRDGRAVLTDGAARATLSANSRLTLSPSQDGFTRFVQDLGAVLFQVDRRSDPHFEVRTSLVAAVVKGTTFTVSVEPDQHSVFVAEGLVEVSPVAGGETEMVSGGSMAEVERDAPDRVETPEAAPQQQSTAPLPLLDYAALSGGLVAARYDGPDDVGDDGAPVALAYQPAQPGVDEDAAGGDNGASGSNDSADEHSGSGGDDDTSGGDDGSGAGSDDDGSTGDDDSGSGGHDAWDGDDDGNDGHGNDDDGDDSGNPGQGGGDDDVDDDGNNGHGNDDEGDDSGNPGNGGGDDDVAGGNNGHGNDDDGDESGNPGHGGGGDDDDDDGDDSGNHGHGGGGGHGNGNGGD